MVKTLVASFNEQVYALVCQIPPGRVMTYGSVARWLGAPRKAREVGWAMHQCPDDVPAHRVINSRGGISGPPGSADRVRREQRLRTEGVRFDASERCDLRVYEWWPDDEVSSSPASP
jgi:methylated-DNA-protein-cysteine methyltransferase-like protein